MKELQQSLRELGSIYQFGEYAAGTIRGIKCALELMGICSGRMADPHRACDESQRNFVEQQLVKLGLLESDKRDEATSDLRTRRTAEAGTVQYS